MTNELTLSDFEVADDKLVISNKDAVEKIKAALAGGDTAAATDSVHVASMPSITIRW